MEALTSTKWYILDRSKGLFSIMKLSNETNKALEETYKQIQNKSK